MILGIMQPYFFPYLGYFDLINFSDRWIVFDTAQYIRHGWINRNRILHPAEGWQYVVVPLEKHRREAEIGSIRIAGGSEWRKRILGQILHYRKRAPFFTDIYELISECLAVQEVFLARFNVHVLDKVCRYLGISFNPTFLSDMEIKLGSITSPGDWALRISEALGAREYVNPPGGAHLFDPKRFEELGIKLTIRNLPVLKYPCPGYVFAPNLSIIDVLLWNPRDTVRNFLDTCNPV